MSKQFQFKLVLLGKYQVMLQAIRNAQLSDYRRICGREVEVTYLSCTGYNSHSMAFSLVLRFVKDQFDDYRESTIGGTPCCPSESPQAHMVT